MLQVFCAINPTGAIPADVTGVTDVASLSGIAGVSGVAAVSDVTGVSGVQTVASSKTLSPMFTHLTPGTLFLLKLKLTM